MRCRRYSWHSRLEEMQGKELQIVQSFGPTLPSFPWIGRHQMYLLQFMASNRGIQHKRTALYAVKRSLHTTRALDERQLRITSVSNLQTQLALGAWGGWTNVCKISGSSRLRLKRITDCINFAPPNAAACALSGCRGPACRRCSASRHLPALGGMSGGTASSLLWRDGTRAAPLARI